MREGLARTRGGFLARLGQLFQGRTVVDDGLMEQMEEVLFTADIGVKTSQQLLEAVQRWADSAETPTVEGVWEVLRSEMGAMLRAHQRSLAPDGAHRPLVVMMVGVNGAGKTTTIGKLAARWQGEGRRVMMVAGDTFRAAAADQLLEWSSRVGCLFHRGEEGADPSGVVFDGLKEAVRQDVDVVLVDTAGRLQTKKPLMDELQKITRTTGKAVPGAPHEVVLVLDANTGQNGLQQARLFAEAASLTGVVLTKLDGTAKGGIVLGVSQELRIPVYFVGIGEAPEDLRPFDAEEFVEALL